MSQTISIPLHSMFVVFDKYQKKSYAHFHIYLMQGIKRFEILRLKLNEPFTELLAK